jgi:hypothetical protein
MVFKVKDIIQELQAFNPEAEIEFEVEILTEGINQDFKETIDGLEYLGISQRQGIVSMGFCGNSRK